MHGKLDELETSSCWYTNDLNGKISVKWWKCISGAVSQAFVYILDTLAKFDCSWIQSQRSSPSSLWVVQDRADRDVLGKRRKMDIWPGLFITWCIWTRILLVRLLKICQNEKLILASIVLFVYALFFNIQVRLTENQPLTTKYNVLPSKSVYQIFFIATWKEQMLRQSKATSRV